MEYHFVCSPLRVVKYIIYTRGVVEYRASENVTAATIRKS